jgi:hypothetical protein
MRAILWLIFLFSIGILVLNGPVLRALEGPIANAFERPAIIIFMLLCAALYIVMTWMLARNRQILALLSIPAAVFEVWENVQLGAAIGDVLDRGRVLAVLMALFFGLSAILAQLRYDESN